MTSDDISNDTTKAFSWQLSTLDADGECTSSYKEIMPYNTTSNAI